MATIKQSEAYLAELQNLILSEDVLKKHGYTTHTLTDEELLLKRRCLGCGKSN
jgi:RNA exonuclease 1